jgi:hypothetical protein
MPRPKAPPVSAIEACPEVDGFKVSLALIAHAALTDTWTKVLKPSEVRQALLQGRFQPNGALKMVDFLDRHGLLEGEDGLEEIRWRVKREQGVAKPVGIGL